MLHLHEYKDKHEIFLSCDWGTSSFRLRLVHAATLAVIAESSSAEGVASVFTQWQQAGATNNRVSFYQGIVQQHIDVIESRIQQTLRGVPLVVSGMASSSIGMQELSYLHLPFDAAASGLLYAQINATETFDHLTILVSGARTERDVMRGEETQLAGCMEGVQKESGLFIFPGTHSKHITVTGGKATELQTFMTGEFFQLLANNSILSNSVAANETLHQNDNKAAFQQGVLDGAGQNLLHVAFHVRTNSLFARYTAAANYWYLSGLLIGAELHVLQQASPASITVVGGGNLAESYLLAFEVLGMPGVSIIDVNSALISAHALIINKVFDSRPE